MFVIIVGLQNCCGEADTEFLLALMQSDCLGSPRPRPPYLGSSRKVKRRAFLGDVSEKDFHICSGRLGIRGGRPRR